MHARMHSTPCGPIHGLLGAITPPEALLATPTTTSGSWEPSCASEPRPHGNAFPHVYSTGSDGRAPNCSLAQEPLLSQVLEGIPKFTSHLRPCVRVAFYVISWSGTPSQQKWRRRHHASKWMTPLARMQKAAAVDSISRYCSKKQSSPYSRWACCSLSYPSESHIYFEERSKSIRVLG